MSMTASTTKNRIMEAVPVWWPILLVLLGVGGSAVRAESQISHNAERIDHVEQSLEAVPERLARIEATQDAQGKQLDRIEGRLEAMR